MRAETKFRRHEVHHDSTVEGVACNGHARSSNDGISAGPFSAWTKMGQREVAGAASEVADQNQLGVVQLGFVLIGGGDWLEFECHFGKAGQVGCCSEPVDCQRLVRFGFRSRKAYGPSDYDAVRSNAELFDHSCSQTPEDDGDQ